MNFTRYPIHWPLIQPPTSVKYQFDINEYLGSTLLGLVQRMLNTHIDTVKEKVSDTVKEKIEEIVNEPEYHTINTAFFNSIRHKVDSQLKDYLEEFDTMQNKIKTLQRYIWQLQICSCISFSVIGIFIFLK